MAERSIRPLAVLLIAGAALGGCGSRQDELDTLFRERLAAKTLACFHPLGQIDSVSAIEMRGEDSFRATIYWKGGFSGDPYETEVELKIGAEVATVKLLADTSKIPAAEPTCLIALQEAPVPRRADGATTSEGAPPPQGSESAPEDATSDGGQ